MIPDALLSTRLDRPGRLWVRIAIVAIVLTALEATPAAGQAPQPPAQPPARVLTLDEALELAQAASEQVAVAAAGVTRAEGNQRLVRSERLPQLWGSASYDRTLRSEFEGLFEPPADDDGGGDDGAGLDFGELPFGQANVYRLGLSFSQTLFTGGRLLAQARQAGLLRENASLGLTSVGGQTELDVAQAFYDAALADRLVAIAEETYAQADRSLKVTEEQRAAGRAAEFDLLRARVARDSLRPSVVRAQNARALAYLSLKQLLELPLHQPLTLVADLEDEVLPAPDRYAKQVAEAEAEIAPRERIAVMQAANDVRIAEQAVSIARAERWPAVFLRSDFGLVDYPTGAPAAFDDWRQNWAVGVGLSMPVFAGGRIRANEAIARAGVVEARARERLTMELAALDLESTRQDLQAARVEWEVSGATIEQAQRAYEIAELRYNEGLSTQLELSDARLQLAQALVTRAEAARNLQVRRIRLALLTVLPLGTAGPAFAPAAVQIQGASPAPPATAPATTATVVGGGQ